MDVDGTGNFRLRPIWQVIRYEMRQVLSRAGTLIKEMIIGADSVCWYST